MPRIGPTELVIILVIVLIIFGVGRLPQVGGALGKGIRAFRRGAQGEDDETEEDAKPKATAKSATKEAEEEEE